MSLFVLVLLMTWCGLLQRGTCQSEGDACGTVMWTGVCKPVTQCPYALDQLKIGVRPQVCGFRGKEADVCCPPAVSTPRPLSPVAISRPRRPPPPVSSPRPPPLPDYEEPELLPGAECRPIPPNASRVLKTGQKAWDKCIEYLKYVYPCELAETLSARKDMARRYQCRHDDVELSPGTRRVADGEIPHMALLGYGSSLDRATWDCAGTIISEHYVLTAATCITNGRDMVMFVRTGLVSMSSGVDQSRIYNVSKFTSSPRYNQQLGHNNIGLARTATPMIFDTGVYPACLHTGDPVDDYTMMATGWGLANDGGSPEGHLKKVTLDKLGNEDCSSGRVRRLPKNQICAGYPADVDGACQVDPGSPLQILNQDVDCMYTVLGVATVGPKCGAGTENGVFTRVSMFTQWIERVVWPN